MDVNTVLYRLRHMNSTSSEDAQLLVVPKARFDAITLADINVDELAATFSPDALLMLPPPSRPGRLEKARGGSGSSSSRISLSPFNSYDHPRTPFSSSSHGMIHS